MQQNENLNRVMETKIIQKNEASLKNLMSRGNFLLYGMLLLVLSLVTPKIVYSQTVPIKLDKTKLELIVGEEQSLRATTNPGGQSVAWTSSDASKATVEGSYGEAKVIAKSAGTVSINATFRGQTVSCTITVYDVFSQTGVTINGVTWATRNVDAPGTFAAKASDAGMYYQWNRKIGWSSTDPLISSPSGRSWDSSVPTGTSWEAANDPCPAGWRVPISEELEKLINANYVWTTVNGKTGVKIGNGNNTIFLRNDSFRNYKGGLGGKFVNSEGVYWSATEYGGNGAHCLWIGERNDARLVARLILNVQVTGRAWGYDVRCVKK